MSKLKELVLQIQENPLVKRFQVLEAIIDSNEKLQLDYKLLLEKQKIMVNAETFKRSNLQELKQDYQQYKSQLISNVIIDEYLELQSEINQDLKLIQDIITEEVNREFE